MPVTTTSNFIDWQPRRLLLDSSLLTTPFRAEQSSEFWSTPDPIGWLVCQGLALDPSSFYQQVARKFQLGFITNIPQRMNPSTLTSQYVPLSELSQSRATVFEWQSETILVLANPCLPKQQLSKLLDLLGGKAKVAVAPHGVISQSQSFLNGYVSSQQVESGLKFARPEYSSQTVPLNRVNLASLVLVTATLVGAALGQWGFLLLCFFILNVFYFLVNPFKIWLLIAGQLKRLEVKITDQQIKLISPTDLPTYTIIVPLKSERDTVPQLLTSLRSLNYPSHLLDIKITYEVDDHTTAQAVAAQGITDHSVQLATPQNVQFQLVKVPPGTLSTKPRSCNFALQLARGQVTVIYDAEDRPEPNQLKKAWLALQSFQMNTLCVQAKLTFYNTPHNILTRWFSLEYGFWFDWFLPGLQALNIPIPLGGTSNHFKTSTLKQIGGWDSANVTEDADLGWRLARNNYTTLVMNSYTHEEATFRLWPWIKQRTRWQKGFIITSLVHGLKPLRLFRELGLWKGCMSLFTYWSVVLLPLLNPFLWVLFVGWILSLTPLIGPLNLPLPSWLAIIGLTNLVLGNATYVLVHVFVALHHRQPNQILPALTTPLYWPLMSLATYRAIWQMITSPFSWEKTTHGPTQ